MNNKDIVIFINAIRPATFPALKYYEEVYGRTLVPIIMVDTKIKAAILERNAQHNHLHKIEVVTADFDDAKSVREALKPYEGRVFAVTSQYENSILELKKIVPYLPYLPMPTEKSLVWATEKKLMRELFMAYDPNITPKFTKATDDSIETVKKIEQKMPYPLIVKPSGLEGSLLVSLVRDRSELSKALKFTFSEIQEGYDTWIKRQEPTILVEEFMEGDMYSVDLYISSSGVFYRTPFVKVITGHKSGHSGDFFGYMQHTDVELDDEQELLAYKTAEDACRALGLRSVTAHIELIRTKSGWKIIELGPRIGGYRHEIYNYGFGINHIANDVLIRAGEKPNVTDKLVQHTALLNIYPSSEGVVRAIEGLENAQNLQSFMYLHNHIKVGEITQFARNNGDPILQFILSHSDKKQFYNDVNRLETEINFKIAPIATT